MERKYVKICKCCDEFFETNQKYSKICRNCREKNHKKKIMNTVFNGNLTENL